MTVVTPVSSLEIKVLFATTVLAWIASLTFLWPVMILLKLSSRLREKFNAWNKYHKLIETEPLREKLFALLSESCPQFACRRLRILELGISMSNDLKEYSNQHVIDIAYEDLESNDKLKCLPNNVFLSPDKKVLKTIPSNSYDVVVSTFYLCSETNVDAALENIRRILKPGGKYAFLEHIGYPEHSMPYQLQRILSPLWERFFSGCNLNMHPLRFLKKSSFATISYQTLYPSRRLPHLRPVTYGVCTN